MTTKRKILHIENFLKYPAPNCVWKPIREENKKDD